MRMTLPSNQNLLVFGLPLGIVLFLILLVRSQVYEAKPELMAKVITLDFLVTIPIVWYLLIRKSAIPKLSTASVFIACMLLASVIIPTEQQAFLDQLKWIAIPLVELAVFGFVTYKAIQAFKTYRTKETSASDVFDAIKDTCQEHFPNRLAHILATEIAVVYYSILSWKKQPVAAGFYTYHRKSGIITVVYVLFFMVAIETFLAHFLLQKWNPVVAWVATGLSAYTCLQIFALTRAMSQRLIQLDTQRGLLHLKYGFFNETKIPLTAIERVELSRKSLPEDGSIVQFSPLSILDTHNIVLTLHTEQEMTRLYGFRKKYKALAVYIDDKDEFVQDLKQALPQDAV